MSRPDYKNQDQCTGAGLCIQHIADMLQQSPDFATIGIISHAEICRIIDEAIGGFHSVAVIHATLKMPEPPLFPILN